MAESSGTSKRREAATEDDSMHVDERDYYKNLINGFIDPSDCFEKNVETWMKTAYKGFNASYIVKKVQQRVGRIGFMTLAWLGAMRGTNTNSFRTIEVQCDGEIKGTQTIEQLVSKGVITRTGATSSINRAKNQFPLSQIAASVPFQILFMADYLKNHDADIISRFAKNVETSLPSELQFTQAASLKLGEKTRKAHMLFTAKFSEKIGSTFNGRVYSIQMKQLGKFEKVPGLPKRLQDIEDKIQLTEEENAVTLEGLSAQAAAKMMTNPMI